MIRNRVSLFVLAVVAVLAFASLSFAQDADPSIAKTAAPAAAAETSGPFDLERCVQRALDLNPSMTAIRAQLQGTKFGTRSALGDFGPALGASYGYTHYDRGYTSSGQQSDWVAKVNIKQPVFKGFNLLATWQKAQLTEESTMASLTKVELALVENVQTTFLDLLKARMDVKSAEDSVARLESQLKVISAFYDVGLRPKAEVLDAEVDLATSKQGLLTAKNNVATQEAQLNTLLNIPIEMDVEYVGELQYVPFNLTLRECLTRAYDHRPDLLIGEKSVEISQKDVTIAESSFYPSVDARWDYVNRGDDAGLNGGGDYTHEGFEYWTAGIEASMSIFEWGSDYYNAKQFDQTVKQLTAELENTRLNAGFEVKRALLSIQEAADRISVAKKSVIAAEEAYRMAVARYQAQVGTNTDVLNAQERLTASEAQLSQALADYGTAVSALYVAMGEKNLGLVDAK
ncbi:TolC family protein [Pseudodesulfovibrio sp. JC047]|uniref:TolC family protein n=1 Tax=Pseudodesulfovibrio sp. JC047 TaxID=2683199 RepID=UPI0013D5DEDE|nr:TolC family protein [Pseudodesulfovibrio sp. JC047]NDV20058.1 TolC family protein [Pseudodesulfovibrio sp. JC047]